MRAYTKYHCTLVTSSLMLQVIREHSAIISAHLFQKFYLPLPLHQLCEHRLTPWTKGDFTGYTTYYILKHDFINIREIFWDPCFLGIRKESWLRHSFWDLPRPLVILCQLLDDIIYELVNDITIKDYFASYNPPLGIIFFVRG